MEGLENPAHCGRLREPQIQVFLPRPDALSESQSAEGMRAGKARKAGKGERGVARGETGMSKAVGPVSVPAEKVCTAEIAENAENR